MEPVELLSAIIVGVMFANVLSAVLFFGARELSKHREDESVPGWAWWCILFPLAGAGLCLLALAT
jgi:hypothetical protein